MERWWRGRGAPASVRLWAPVQAGRSCGILSVMGAWRAAANQAPGVLCRPSPLHRTEPIGRATATLWASSSGGTTRSHPLPTLPSRANHRPPRRSPAFDAPVGLHHEFIVDRQRLPKGPRVAKRLQLIRGCHSSTSAGTCGSRPDDQRLIDRAGPYFWPHPQPTSFCRRPAMPP